MVLAVAELDVVVVVVSVMVPVNLTTSPFILSHRHLIFVSDSLAWLSSSTQTSEGYETHHTANTVSSLEPPFVGYGNGTEGG